MTWYVCILPRFSRYTAVLLTICVNYVIIPSVQRVLIAPNIQTGSQQLPIENGHYNAVFSSEGGIGAGGLPPPGAAPRTGRAATSFSDGPPTHFASAAPSAGTPRRGMPPTPPRHSHHSSSRESEKTQSQHDSAGHGGCMYREVFSALGFMVCLYF